MRRSSYAATFAASVHDAAAPDFSDTAATVTTGPACPPSPTGAADTATVRRRPARRAAVELYSSEQLSVQNYPRAITQTVVNTIFDNVFFTAGTR